MSRRLRVTIVLALALVGCSEAGRPSATQPADAPQQAQCCFESECGSFGDDRVVPSLAGGMSLALLESHELSGPRPFVEINENGRFTYSTYVVRFASATTLDGSTLRADEDVLASVPDTTLYEDTTGARHRAAPCDADAPTAANRLLAADGGAVALLLQHWAAEAVYLVREVLVYQPAAGVVVLGDRSVTLDELTVLVDMARSQQGMTEEPDWIELPGKPPFDPTPPPVPTSDGGA